MALALGSIASKFNSIGDLTAADRAYIEEFRNANTDTNDSMDKFSATYLSQNPYQASFQLQKQQIMHQNLLLKRLRQQTRWKHCLIWISVLTIIAIVFTVVVFVFSRYVRPEYVQFFTILISILAFVCLMVVIGSHFTH